MRGGPTPGSSWSKCIESYKIIINGRTYIVQLSAHQCHTKFVNKWQWYRQNIVVKTVSHAQIQFDIKRTKKNRRRRKEILDESEKRNKNAERRTHTHTHTYRPSYNAQCQTDWSDVRPSHRLKLRLQFYRFCQVDLCYGLFPSITYASDL